MAEITLAAETGRTTGSRASGRLRASGKVPGSVYGLGNGLGALVVGRDMPEPFRRLMGEMNASAELARAWVRLRRTPSLWIIRPWRRVRP